MDTNRIIEGPDIDFGEFLQFIGIWMLLKENLGMNLAEYFIQNHIDIDLFSGLSLCVNHLMSGKLSLNYML